MLLKNIIITLFTIYLTLSICFANISYQNKINTFLGSYSNNLKILYTLKNNLDQKLLRDKEYTSEQLEIITYFKNQTENKIQTIQKNESYIPTQKTVNALYYSAYATSISSNIDEFIDVANDTDVNAIVIDIKEIDGKTSFLFNNNDFGDIKPVSNDRISDISPILKKLKDNNIYTIGRIVVFKDNYLSAQRPDLAIKWSWDTHKNWGDYKGNSYTDPGSEEVWDYHVELASAAYKLGFDEINFDYVRFPSDGYISQTYYPQSKNILNKNPTWGKMMVIDSFSEYINRKLKKIHPNIIISADVFGLVTNTNLFQIGQNLESFVLYFDYVAPMIYPSHYSVGYLGYAVPDNAPYEIFYNSMETAKTKIDELNQKIGTAQSGTGELLIQGVFQASSKKSQLNKVDYNKIRPWLQGFNCTWCAGATNYNSSKFQKQIQAITDLGFTSGWYVWNASANYYKSWY